MLVANDGAGQSATFVQRDKKTVARVIALVRANLSNASTDRFTRVPLGPLNERVSLTNATLSSMWLSVYDAHIHRF